MEIPALILILHLVLTIVTTALCVQRVGGQTGCALFFVNVLGGWPLTLFGLLIGTVFGRYIGNYRVKKLQQKKAFIKAELDAVILSQKLKPDLRYYFEDSIEFKARLGKRKITRDLASPLLLCIAAQKDTRKLLMLFTCFKKGEATTISQRTISFDMIRNFGPSQVSLGSEQIPGFVIETADMNQPRYIGFH